MRLPTAIAVLLFAALARAQDPFADALVSYTPGTNGGFGADELPGIVLGPPRGGGALQQSLDTVSLGNGGVIVLRFDLPVICDGPGADLTVFENAFHTNTPDGPVFEEYGIVAVSQDGEHFVEFPYDPVTHAGLAGRTAVFSNPDNGIDPLDPTVSGGDQFDLAEVGLTWAAYVRITDPGATIDDPGNHIPPGDKGGFDLDALAALHACNPSSPTATATSIGTAETPGVTPTPTATPRSEQSATATAVVVTETPTATPATTATLTSAREQTATATPPVLVGDVDGDGHVGAADLSQLVAEIYDGDGDETARAGGSAVASDAAVDVNADGRVTAADIAALLGHWAP